MSIRTSKMTFEGQPENVIFSRELEVQGLV